MKIDPQGVVSDVSPHDVGDEWTDVQNMRFRDTRSEKMRGEREAALPTEQPDHLLFNGRHGSPLWFYMGDGLIRSTDFTTDTDLYSGVSITSGTDWDATLFNLIPVFNNTLDIPWYWDGTSADVAPLPAFDADIRCQAIRPFRSFLVALNITDTSVQDGNRLIWSDSSDAGALPASWNIADPGTLAGDSYLTSTKGEIIDGLQLRDLFVIYKTHSTYIMRLTNLQSVMKVERVQLNSGILAKNCVTEFKGRHFVVADGDIVLFDGQNIESIAEKRVRDRIFGTIDTTYFYNSYVVRYDRNDEIWFCYPEQGQEFSTKAAVWNWQDNNWTFRDISARHIASGLTNLGARVTWDSLAETWDTQSYIWNPVANNPTTDTLLKAAGARFPTNIEMCPDPTCDDETKWTLPGGSQVTGGQLILGNSDIAGFAVPATEIGKTYRFTVDVVSLTDTVSFSIGGVGSNQITGSGSYDVTAIAEVPEVSISANALGDVTIESVSVKEVVPRALNILDEGDDIVGTAMPSKLEKSSMDFGDPSVVKLVNKVIPRITAEAGTKIYISVGSQMDADDAISWNPEQLYAVGVDREVSTIIKGRFISIKYRTQDNGVFWAHHGTEFDWRNAGRH